MVDSDVQVRPVPPPPPSRGKGRGGQGQAGGGSARGGERPPAEVKGPREGQRPPATGQQVPPAADNNTTPRPPPRKDGKDRAKEGEGGRRGGERPMGTTADGGGGSEGRAANGDLPMGAARCRRDQYTEGHMPPTSSSFTRRVRPVVVLRRPPGGGRGHGGGGREGRCIGDPVPPMQDRGVAEGEFPGADDRACPRDGRGGAVDAQTAHPATFSTAPAHQLLGSANAATTPAGAPAAAADRTQRPDATCEGEKG